MSLPTPSSVINVTTPDHALHPGFVKRKLYVSMEDYISKLLVVDGVSLELLITQKPMIYG